MIFVWVIGVWLIHDVINKYTPNQNENNYLRKIKKRKARIKKLEKEILQWFQKYPMWNKTEQKNEEGDVIFTEDLFTALNYYEKENKGPWKQGWDYEYDGRFDTGEKLHIHLVPHSHNDPGWLKTYSQYYSQETKHILNTLVDALTKDRRRTVIWAEMSYLSLWWAEASDAYRKKIKAIVKSKQFDIVTGGWVMNDEASSSKFAIKTQLEEGLKFCKRTFNIVPQYSWQIDPFGHSAGQAAVLKSMGYKASLIQRVHYGIKKMFAKEQNLEFLWNTPHGKLFTHMMPFYSYDAPHTCGPDPSICCQFDFKRIGAGRTWLGCPWGKIPQVITQNNVKERSLLWLDQVRKKAMLYKTRHILIPLGDDFRYQSSVEAERQYTNYQKMFDYLNKHENVIAEFSTLSRYFDAVLTKHEYIGSKLAVVEGSFFPYSDRIQDYWTGYFNSRIFYKGYDRLLETKLKRAMKTCSMVDLSAERRALALFQHHDGITGTAKPFVVQDYFNTLKNAVRQVELQCPEKEVKLNPCKITEGNNFIKFDTNGNIRAIGSHVFKEEIRWYKNIDAGVYLMHTESKYRILNGRKPTVCKREGKNEYTTDYGILKRTITDDLFISYDINIQKNKEMMDNRGGELMVAYTAGDSKYFCRDANGMQIECHKEKNTPFQAKFYPMSEQAWLITKKEKLIFLSAQPTGVGMVKKSLLFMLDRFNRIDDHRGMATGAVDVRRSSCNFTLMFKSTEPYTYIKSI